MPCIWRHHRLANVKFARDFSQCFQPPRLSRTTFDNLFFQSAADYEGARHECTMLPQHLDYFTREISLFFLSVLFSSLWKSESLGLISCTFNTSTGWYLRIFESKKFNTVVYSFRALSIKSAQTASTQPWWNSVWVTRLINNKCRCFPNLYCMRWLQFFKHKYLKATEKYLVFETVFSGASRINRSLHSLARLLPGSPHRSLPFVVLWQINTWYYYLYWWLKSNIQTRYLDKSMTFGLALPSWIDIYISCQHYGVPLFSSVLPLLYSLTFISCF